MFVRNIAEHFDKIYCINLKHRTDLWQESLAEFEKLGIADSVERFEAVNKQPGIIGCTKSHYEIIKKAKENNFKNILIFEDDVEIVQENAADLISQALQQLKDRNITYDMFYLGGNLTGKKNMSYRIDDNLAKLDGCKTTHAYAISSAAYDYVLNAYDDLDWDNPWNWSQGNQNRFNIDKWYTMNLQSRNNTYGVYPCVADQRHSYSDLLHRVSDITMRNRYNEVLHNDLTND